MRPTSRAGRLDINMATRKKRTRDSRSSRASRASTGPAGPTTALVMGPQPGACQRQGLEPGRPSSRNRYENPSVDDHNQDDQRRPYSAHGTSSPWSWSPFPRLHRCAARAAALPGPPEADCCRALPPASTPVWNPRITLRDRLGLCRNRPKPNYTLIHPAPATASPASRLVKVWAEPRG